jgi:hypothetical protein
MYDRPRARTEEVISDWVDDSLVVYDQSRHTAHALTAIATSVWEACDGRHTVDDISGVLKLDVPVVERALHELSDCQLLEADPVIDLGNGLSRREAAKRFAKVGAAALAAPMIYSINVSPALAAGSIVCSLANGASVNNGHCTAAPGAVGTSSGTASQCCASGSCYQDHTGGSGTMVCVGACAPFNSPCGTGTACCADAAGGTANCVGGFCAQ